MQLRLAADAIRLQVTDSGVGIAPDQLPLIFDAFYRADKTTKGSGLGLFIVKTIVNAHGGKVDAASRPGEGSTFTITLPGKPADQSPWFNQVTLPSVWYEWNCVL